jgi:hypothetical protein
MNSCQLVIACAAGAGFFQPVAASRATIDVHGRCVDHCAGRGPWRPRQPRAVAARSPWYGRSGARLRQTIVALAGGRVMGEHKSPGDASVFCLRGRVLLRAGRTPSWDRVT